MDASTVSPQGVRPLRQGDPDGHATPAGPGAAAEQAVARHSVTFDVFGTHIELPPVEQLAFLAGVGALAAFEIIEWPVALVLGVGHQLAHSHHNQMLREFGEAMEEA
ncbi:hypothetical protein [Streptomyces sp. NPDC098781]|uniref:hypothetical protein n=1 Tax=Streptomyces sp. NPDC098781 TaxID=3366097 RepID=UPI003801B4E0